TPARAAKEGGGARRRASPGGRNGVSPGALRTSSAPSPAAQASPTQSPASGPSPAVSPSGSTGAPKPAKRAGSPLALIASHRASSRSTSITRARIGAPPTYNSGLSTPPRREALPPASTSAAIRVIEGPDR